MQVHLHRSTGGATITFMKIPEADTSMLRSESLMSSACFISCIRAYDQTEMPTRYVKGLESELADLRARISMVSGLVYLGTLY